jgi:hypothetical protein
MLTLFAVPKPFEGHIGVIQRNAIRSWARLDPPCQIVLLGNEVGTREVAEELGARHEPTLALNKYGTPLVDDIFHRAESHAESSYMCYVNADIILFSDLAKTLSHLESQRRPFLIVGRRTDLDITEPLTFREGWQDRLVSKTGSEGHLHAATGIDYFVFRKGLFGEIPPFALGRTYWDNWLLYRARSRGALLIDATNEVLAIHQNHGYGSVGRDGIWNGPEAIQNCALGGSQDYILTIDDASHLFVGNRLRSSWFQPPLRRKFEVAAVLNPRWSWLYRMILRVLDHTHSIRARFGLANVGSSEDSSV